MKEQLLALLIGLRVTSGPKGSQYFTDWASGRPAACEKSYCEPVTDGFYVEWQPIMSPLTQNLNVNTSGRDTQTRENAEVPVSQENPHGSRIHERNNHGVGRASVEGVEAHTDWDPRVDRSRVIFRTKVACGSLPDIAGLPGASLKLEMDFCGSLMYWVPVQPIFLPGVADLDLESVPWDPGSLTPGQVHSQTHWIFHSGCITNGLLQFQVLFCFFPLLGLCLKVRYYNDFWYQLARDRPNITSEGHSLSLLQTPTTSSGVPRPPVLLTNWLQIQGFPSTFSDSIIH